MTDRCLAEKPYVGCGLKPPCSYGRAEGASWHDDGDRVRRRANARTRTVRSAEIVAGFTMSETGRHTSDARSTFLCTRGHAHFLAAVGLAIPTLTGPILQSRLYYSA